MKASFEGLDLWLRRKLRGILWRQWKTPPTRLRELCRRGLDRRHASAVVYGSHGPWASAGTQAMYRAVSPAWLTQLGLVSFLDESRRLAPGSRTAVCRPARTVVWEPGRLAALATRSRGARALPALEPSDAGARIRVGQVVMRGGTWMDDTTFSRGVSW